MIGYPLDSHVEFDDNNIPAYDRAVSSAPLRKLIKKLFSDGVMPNPSTNLQVAAGTGMNVVVKPGFAICNGCMKLEEEQVTLALKAADASYARIDTVVLRLDDNDTARSCELAVLTGTPSANPVRPNLTRNASVWEIGLADIKVAANVASVTNASITDTRYQTSRCGVISSISEFDTTTLYQQIQTDLSELRAEEQADFEVWFNEMKNQLSTDAAGNLQKQIEVERERINNLVKMEEGSTTGDAELADIRAGADGINYPTAGEAVRRQFESAKKYAETRISETHKEFEFIPVGFNLVRKDYSLDPSIVNKIPTLNDINAIAREGYALAMLNVSKGDVLVCSNSFDLSSDVPFLYHMNNEHVFVSRVSFDTLESSGSYVFPQDGYAYMCFGYTNVAAGEFFYIKKVATNEPLVLYADKAAEYEDDSSIGEKALKYIMEGKQIYVRVPNADGGDYTAIYSPVLTYQLPNKMNSYLYLFFLKDEKQDLSALGLTGVQLPTYGQLKLKLSRDYNQTPLLQEVTYVFYWNN